MINPDYAQKILRDHRYGMTLTQLINKFTAVTKFEIVDLLMEARE